MRGIICNAVVNRDYSFKGKDIKVAIYDDMIELSNSGLLPQSFDYAAMKCWQSDARNKVIAPIFKWLGIIDQWGNGLKLIVNELNEYSEIDFKCREVGLSFQVQFKRLNLVTDKRKRHTWGTLGAQSEVEFGVEFGVEYKKLTISSHILI